MDNLIAYCLPVQDGKYENPFKFQCIIIDSNYLECKLWGNVKLNTGSVILVHNTRKWWQVTNSEPYKVGNIFTCITSDFTPSFGGV